MSLTSPAPVRVHAGQHPVHPVGVVASLPAVFLQLADVRQGVQGAAEIGLPCLRVRLVFARTESP